MHSFNSNALPPFFIFLGLLPFSLLGGILLFHAILFKYPSTWQLKTLANKEMTKKKKKKKKKKYANVFGLVVVVEVEEELAEDKDKGREKSFALTRRFSHKVQGTITKTKTISQNAVGEERTHTNSPIHIKKRMPSAASWPSLLLEKMPFD
jgi:hypothetical protein